MVDTRVNLCGISMDNPVIPASGTFGYGYEFAEIYDMRPDYASKTVGMSTALSMFTIPVAVVLCNLILKL